MAARWDDVLVPLETAGEGFALLAGKQLLEARHVLGLLVLDVVVQHLHQRV
jgi:hypothetical protein